MFTIKLKRISPLVIVDNARLKAFVSLFVALFFSNNVNHTGKLQYHWPLFYSNIYFVLFGTLRSFSLYVDIFCSAGGLKRYLAAVSGLAYDERPDYNGLKQCLRSRAGKEWTLGLSEPTSASKVSFVNLSPRSFCSCDVM